MKDTFPLAISALLSTRRLLHGWLYSPVRRAAACVDLLTMHERQTHGVCVLMSLTNRRLRVGAESEPRGLAFLPVVHSKSKLCAPSSVPGSGKCVSREGESLFINQACVCRFLLSKFPICVGKEEIRNGSNHTPLIKKPSRVAKWTSHYTCTYTHTRVLCCWANICAACERAT